MLPKVLLSQVVVYLQVMHKPSLLIRSSQITLLLLLTAMEMIMLILKGAASIVILIVTIIMRIQIMTAVIL